MSTRSLLASMAVVAGASSNALAQFCTDTVEGTSGTDGMALCMRYATGTNRVYVAVCTGGNLTWVDVCDTSGVLTDDVTIRGLGGADGLWTVDFAFNSEIDGGCTIQCWGEVDIDTYTVALEGGSGSDSLYTQNETGLVTMDGAAGADVLIGGD